MFFFGRLGFVSEFLKDFILPLVVVAFIFFVLGEVSWVKGVLLGGMASIFNFCLMALLLPYAVERRRGIAEGMSFVSIIVRFFVMGIALSFAFSNEGISTVVTCVALFTVQLVLLGKQFFYSKIYSHLKNIMRDS